MGFWSFMRDIFVFDWLFGHRNKESFWERSQREGQHYTDNCRHYDHNSDYGGYSNNDYVQQDFDDDLDSSMCNDDF